MLLDWGNPRWATGSPDGTFYREGRCPVRNAITETTAAILVLVLTAVIILSFDVLGMIGEWLTYGFKPLF